MQVSKAPDTALRFALGAAVKCCQPTEPAVDVRGLLDTPGWRRHLMDADKERTRDVNLGSFVSGRG